MSSGKPEFLWIWRTLFYNRGHCYWPTQAAYVWTLLAWQNIAYFLLCHYISTVVLSIIHPKNWGTLCLHSRLLVCVCMLWLHRKSWRAGYYWSRAELIMYFACSAFSSFPRVHLNASIKIHLDLTRTAKEWRNRQTYRHMCRNASNCVDWAFGCRNYRIPKAQHVFL